MFNLEQAIADWRRQMLAVGIKTPVPLEELEIHLRDEIEELGEDGATFIRWKTAAMWGATLKESSQN